MAAIDWRTGGTGLSSVHFRGGLSVVDQSDRHGQKDFACYSGGTSARWQDSFGLDIELQLIQTRDVVAPWCVDLRKN